jgi:CspA family cold shock protein
MTPDSGESTEKYQGGIFFMVKGKVKWFNENKGYGFIQEESENQDIFVHYSDIEGDGFRTLSEGDSVEFEPFQGPKGLQAKKVRKV